MELPTCPPLQFESLSPPKDIYPKHLEVKFWHNAGERPILYSLHFVRPWVAVVRYGPVANSHLL